jgi:uncharacterized 2Fe-2S/4Fe-4S cluster protein (DUF4445 family)
MATDARLIVHAPHEKIVVEIEANASGQRLTEWLRHADLPLNTRCGQRGLCDGCLIELVSGSLIRADSGQVLDGADGPMLVQGCQCCPMPGRDATIQVPGRSLLAHRPQVVTSFRIDVCRAHDPLWQRITLDAEQLANRPDLVSAACEILRHHRSRKPQEVPIQPDPALAAWLALDRAVHCLVLEHRGEHWVLRPDPDSSAAEGFGMAIDVGTTTVVAMLVDLSNGQIRNTASALNGQARLGDNVLTRINHCLQKPEMVRRMQHAVCHNTIRPLLIELLTESGIAIEQLKIVVIAGNTTMLHLVAGVDPSPLGTAPFIPAFVEHRVLAARSLSLLPPSSVPASSDAKGIAGRSGKLQAADPTVHLLPGAAAYLGADVIAGVLSTGMAYRDQPCLLVDVGTNGEIVLKQGDRLFGCATAAGPAFEGAGLTSGVRAGDGAISHIRLDRQTAEPEIEVIGRRPPIGVCGTGYVDFIAEGRVSGLIGPTGRFSDRFAQHPRLVHRANHRGFEIEQRSDGKGIRITESDIASLLQAKAAIAAGIVCLLRRAELRPEEVATLYLAGGFGFHMNIDSVLRCGLLPGFSGEQIELVGNSSLAGALVALMDSGVLVEMKEIAQRLEMVELNLEPDFESVYIDQLSLA